MLLPINIRKLIHWKTVETERKEFNIGWNPKILQKNNSRNKAIRSFNYPFDAKLDRLEKIGISWII